MSDQLFERAVHDWLEDGSDRTPPAAIDAVLLAVKTTPQERDLRIPRRYTLMPISMRLAAGIAVVAVAGVLAFNMLGPGPGVGTRPTPSPTPLPTATPIPTATAEPSPTTNPLLDTATWTTYTSTQYGFEIGHPPEWTVAPATRAWTSADAGQFLNAAQENFRSANGNVRVSAWVIPLAPETAIETWADLEAWVTDFCPTSDSRPCTGIHDRVVPMCIEPRDCHPALLVPFESDTLAFGTGGVLPKGMLVVAVWWDETAEATAPYGGSRRLLEGFLSTLGVVPPAYPESQDAAATFVVTGK